MLFRFLILVVKRCDLLPSESLPTDSVNDTYNSRVSEGFDETQVKDLYNENKVLVSLVEPIVGHMKN